MVSPLWGTVGMLCEHIITPFHTITFSKTSEFIIKPHSMMMLSLALYIFDDSITMTIRHRESAIFFAPTHEVREQTTFLCPVTA